MLRWRRSAAFRSAVMMATTVVVITSGHTDAAACTIMNLHPKSVSNTFGIPADDVQKTNAAQNRNKVVITVGTDPTSGYVTRQELISRGLRQALQNAAQQRTDTVPQAHVRMERLDTFVTWPGPSHTYAIDEDGTVVDTSAGVRLPTPPHLRLQLTAVRERLRAAHYGALLPWNEATSIVPRMAKFELVDVETGLKFQGQRRAGSAHADVQPLTKRDSDMLKRIYGGHWSWDRRAVLLRYDGRQYAASMNGKPHGGDGIPGNGFNGHFCVHFLSSTTHSKANVDLAHQAMVHKAGGRLSPFLRQLSPYEAADLFVIAYNQQDRRLLNALAADGDGQGMISETFRERGVTKLRRNNPLPLKSDTPSHIDEPSLAWSMDAAIYFEGSTRAGRGVLTFELVRSPSEGWQIHKVSL